MDFDALESLIREGAKETVPTGGQLWMVIGLGFLIGYILAIFFYKWGIIAFKGSGTDLKYVYRTALAASLINFLIFLISMQSMTLLVFYSILSFFLFPLYLMSAHDLTYLRALGAYILANLFVAIYVIILCLIVVGPNFVEEINLYFF